MKINIRNGDLRYLPVDIDQFLKIYTIKYCTGNNIYPIKEIFNLTLLKTICSPCCYVISRLCNLINLKSLNFTASSKDNVRIVDKKSIMPLFSIKSLKYAVIGYFNDENIELFNKYNKSYNGKYNIIVMQSMIVTSILFRHY